MKNFLKILILPIAVVTMLGSFAPRVFAVVDPMTVIFENAPLPLFGAVNFLPGDSKDGDATVTNNTPDVQNVYAESVNGFDPDGLGTQLRLRVLEGATVRYDDVFGDFLSAGPVSLSSLGAGATTVYTFEVSFINSADNDYMGKSLGFDLCIGFSGGTFQCGDTVVSDPEDPVTPSDPPGGGGGGGGGGGSGGGGGGVGGQPTQLVIYNEFVSGITEGLPAPTINDGTAIIEWDTNLLATSQVIFGPTSGAPYTLNTNILPNLGYPFGTVENGTKVLHHTVVLTGLIDGETYVYRVVSRASPPTVSQEHTFTMLTDTNTNINTITLAVAGSVGNGAFATLARDTASASSTEEDEEESGLLALALGGLNSGPSSLLCIGLAIIIFLVLLWLTWVVSKNKKNKSLLRDTVFLVIFGLVASVILWLIPYTCPIIPLWVIIALYVVWRLVIRKHHTIEKPKSY